MNLQVICEQYAAFRKGLGERFKVNGSQLRTFCRAMGPDIDIADVSPEKVNAFLIGRRSTYNQLVCQAQRSAWVLSIRDQSRVCDRVAITAHHSGAAKIQALHLFAY